MKARNYLAPLQTSVATPAGIEATIHAASSFIHAHGQDNKLAMVQVGLVNAFNVVSRRTILNEIATHLPELGDWTSYCYGPDTRANLWVRDERFHSTCGMQQGDPLGPLYFAMAIHPILTDINTIMKRSTAPAFLSFYLDDGIMIGTHVALREALTLLEAPQTKARGMHVCMRKCNLWWTSSPPEDEMDLYPLAL